MNAHHMQMKLLLESWGRVLCASAGPAWNYWQAWDEGSSASRGWGRGRFLLHKPQLPLKLCRVGEAVSS